MNPTSATTSISSTPAARQDLVLAGAIGAAATLIYLLTTSPDWIWDTLRYADWMNRGLYERLVLVVHPLANLVPMGLFSALGKVIPKLGPLTVLEVAAAASSGLALTVTYLAARRLGGPRTTSVAAVAMLGATLGFWRAGASAGVYGLSLLALAGTWLLAARYVTDPTPRRAGALGGGAGLCIATHLALIMAVPAFLLLVIGVPEGGSSRRWTRFGPFALAAAGTTTVTWVLSAGISRGWNWADMLEWPITSHGAVADPSASIGWGLRGLMSAIAAPGALGRGTGVGQLVAITITLVVVTGGLLAAIPLLRRSGDRRVLGAALVCNLSFAIGAAAWYQSQRPDYFALGLVPLALLGPVGAGSLSRPDLIRRATAFSLIPICLLALWNGAFGVRPVLDRSKERASAAVAISEVAPTDSRLVLSPSVMPFVAYSGFTAHTGWGALLEAARRSPAEYDAAELVRALVMADGDLLASSRAFVLLPAQERHLSLSEDELWDELRSCCRMRPIANFETERGNEILYRVTLKERSVP